MGDRNLANCALAHDAVDVTPFLFPCQSGQVSMVQRRLASVSDRAFWDHVPCAREFGSAVLKVRHPALASSSATRPERRVGPGRSTPVPADSPRRWTALVPRRYTASSQES